MTTHDYAQLSTMVDFIVLPIKLVVMVLGVSYSRVLAQRPTGCCSASYYIYEPHNEKHIIGLCRENAIAIESEARRAFAHKERNLHCDVHVDAEISKYTAAVWGSLDSFWFMRPQRSRPRDCNGNEERGDHGEHGSISKETGPGRNDTTEEGS